MIDPSVELGESYLVMLLVLVFVHGFLNAHLSDNIRIVLLLVLVFSGGLC